MGGGEDGVGAGDKTVKPETAGGNQVFLMRPWDIDGRVFLGDQSMYF